MYFQSSDFSTGTSTYIINGNLGGIPASCYPFVEWQAGVTCTDGVYRNDRKTYYNGAYTFPTCYG